MNYSDRCAIIQQMPRSNAGRRLLRLAILCAIVALGGRVHADAVRAAATMIAPQNRSDASGFRLGTAGRPFAWSTAVGDLNADGHPDVAIADRIGRRAAGFAYTIELSIAGGRSQSVAFDSDQDALSIALRDVDHDRDLDVVITGAVSRSIVGVWLNDGTGRFRRATPQVEQSSWRASTSALTETYASDPAAAEALPRSFGDGVVHERSSGGVPLPGARLVTCGAFRTARGSISARRSRAPPNGSRSVDA